MHVEAPQPCLSARALPSFLFAPPAPIEFFTSSFFESIQIPHGFRLVWGRGVLPDTSTPEYGWCLSGPERRAW